MPVCDDKRYMSALKAYGDSLCIIMSSTKRTVNEIIKRAHEIEVKDINCKRRISRICHGGD